jgi:hypothetical protein
VCSAVNESSRRAVTVAGRDATRRYRPARQCQDEPRCSIALWGGQTAASTVTRTEVESA